MLHYHSFYRTYRPTYVEYICHNMDRHTASKWLIHGPQIRKDKQSQILKHSCGIPPFENVNMY